MFNFELRLLFETLLNSPEQSPNITSLLRKPDVITVSDSLRKIISSSPCQTKLFS